MKAFDHRNFGMDDSNEINDVNISVLTYKRNIDHLLNHGYQKRETIDRGILETSIVIKLQVIHAGEIIGEEFWVKQCFKPRRQR